MASDLTPKETHMVDQIRAASARELGEFMETVKEIVAAVEAAPDYDGDETRTWVGIATALERYYGERGLSGIAAEAIMRLLELDKEKGNV